MIIFTTPYNTKFSFFTFASSTPERTMKFRINDRLMTTRDKTSNTFYNIAMTIQFIIFSKIFATMERSRRLKRNSV